MFYENLFRKLCAIVLFGYGVFLLAQNYKVEVDDYFSYKEVHSGETDLIFQPLFNLFFSAFKLIDYDLSRLMIGLFICTLLAILIWVCRSRFWYLLVFTFAWYLESLAVIHIRMGLAFALFGFLYPRRGNPIWIIITSLIHYAVLFNLLIYFVIKLKRFQAAIFLFFYILCYNILPWLEHFKEMDQYKVYIDIIPVEYLEYAFFSMIAFALLMIVSQSLFSRFLIIAAIITLSKLFLGVELGGRLSSIFILFFALAVCYPDNYRKGLSARLPKFPPYSRE